jgi:riboflavin synthase
MFTGIITAIGEVRAREGRRLEIAAPPAIMEELRIGGSVAVSGVCLTAVAVDRTRGAFAADLSPETLARTTLGGLRPGGRVNLELPLRPTDRLGGHFVQGHIDTVGRIIAIEPHGEAHLFTFRVDPRYDGLLVEKGSVAIDGMSLTPFEVQKGRFHVAIVPHTLQSTTLQDLRPGDRVNVEFDLLAKYVAKHLREGVQLKSSWH